MPYNGSGSFSLIYNWQQDALNGINISSSRMMGQENDIAAGLSLCLTKDGQQTPVANLPMGGFRFTNMGNATAQGNAVSVQDVQNGSLVTLTTVAGTDTITANTAPSITAYAAGQRFQFLAAGANTTNVVTLNINGLGAKNVMKAGPAGLVAIAPGDIGAGTFPSVVYDGTQFQLQTQSTSSIVGRNRLINGDFIVSQYNGPTAVTPTASGYVIDRWQAAISQASKLTFQQIVAPTGFLNVSTAMKINVAASFSPGAGDFFVFRQPIEGINVRDFQWGTSSAKSISLQIQVSATLTGTYSIAFQNYAQTRSYVTTINVTAANTPQLFTISIPGDTAGSWAAIGSTGFMYWSIDLGSGSNFNAATGSWGAGNTIRTAGAISLVANAGASITISGLQLETGAPTSLEVLSVSAVIAQCQRYYVSGVFSQYYGPATSANVYGSSFSFPPMRTNPTVLGSTNLASSLFPTTVGTVAFFSGGWGQEARSANATGNSGTFASTFNLQAEL